MEPPFDPSELYDLSEAGSDLPSRLAQKCLDEGEGQLSPKQIEILKTALARAANECEICGLYAEPGTEFCERHNQG